MNNSIAIFSWIIYWISRIHHYAFKAAAIIEAEESQTRDGVAKGDGGQTAAIPEAVISQTCDGVGNGDGGQTAAIRVSITNYLSALSLLNGRKVKP